MCFFALATVALAPAPAAAGAAVSYGIETVAGSNAVGDGGPAVAAGLSDTQGVAVDGAGNTYIADANDHRLRKVTPDGLISTVTGNGFAGSGGDGGPAAAAQLNMPYGVAVDAAGNLYIADLGNNRVRKISAGGVISTIAGTGPEKWLAPRNVALDGAGSVYIAEFEGHRVRKITADGVVYAVAGTGESGFTGDGGAAAAAKLSYPAGLALDGSGNLYIADSGNHCVRKVSAGLISTVAGTGEPGDSLPYQLNIPTGVAIDAAGNLYIADSGNHRVQKFSPGGSISTIAVWGRDVALDAAGNLYVAGGSQVVEVTPAGAVVPVAGNGSYHFRGDGGPAVAARLNGPAAIALTPSSDLYIADQSNHRIRKVTAAGVISTVAGKGTPGSGWDELNFPSGLALDAGGTLYIADQNNDRIQQLTPSGATATIAGTGTPGFNGDGLWATSAQLFSPASLALASDGSLYIADAGNRRVRRLSPLQVITTAAQFVARGLAVDGLGNLYIADTEHHCVRRLAPTGVASTVAGSGEPAFGGDGGPAVDAQLNLPRGLAIDSRGNLFIADSGNHRIRMVTPDGIMHTIAGDGTAGFGGDGGPALSAQLRSPSAVALDAAGSVWFADFGNNRVRKLMPAAAPTPEPQTRNLGVAHAASLLPGAVAPGEIVSIFGSGIGPGDGVSGQFQASGILETQVWGTQVFFDGKAAPLFYVQENQVNAQTPYAVAGRSATEIEVFFKGVSQGKATVAVADAAPGIFTLAHGTGQAVAVNQDGSLNSEANPAPRQSVVTLYATGEGQTNPAGIDGKASSAPFPRPMLPVSLTIGGYPAEILFAGEAPGFAGLLQINARVPGGFAPTGVVQLSLRVGTAASQSGVTIAVH